MILVVNLRKRNKLVPNCSVNSNVPEVNTFLWINLFLLIGRGKQLILWYFLPKWWEYCAPLINSYHYSDILPAQEHQVNYFLSYICSFGVVISCLISMVIVNTDFVREWRKNPTNIIFLYQPQASQTKIWSGLWSTKLKLSWLKYSQMTVHRHALF